MTNPINTGVGGTDDSVKLVINKQQVLLAKKWTVKEGILQQPAGFSITLGSGDLAATILSQFQPGPNYIFQLYVGGQLQQSGYLDSVGVSQSRGGAAEVTLKGRDAMAPLQDTYVDGVIASNVATYSQMVWTVLQKLNIAPSGPVDHTFLQLSNDANRNIKSGVSVPVTHELFTIDQILHSTLPGSTGTTLAGHTPQAKLHETWHQYIRRHIDRAGLFLWAAADGSFVLSAPNGQQQPTYLLRRRTGDPQDALRANVSSCNYHDDRTYRHSECVVYGKGGGKRFGRVKSKGDYQDQEMMASGYVQPIVYRDANCKGEADADFFARRKLAEERRNGWMLEYTVSGHTLPAMQQQTGGWGGVTRAVLTPDTVVRVEDDEIGLHDNYYLESLERSRGPETTTTIRLMRIGDLIFGEDE